VSAPFGAGRDVTRLLADFGHDLPLAAPPAVVAKEGRLFERVGVRGERSAGRGWAPSRPPVAAYRMTSDQAPVLWPFIAGPGLPAAGAQMGLDVQAGSAFYADPLGWTLDEAIPVTNGNVSVFGHPGTGKSATTKAFALRMTEFGYRVLVLGDTKDEYEPACRFFGVEPIALGPGMRARVNPLAFGPLRAGWENLSAEQTQARSAIVFTRWLNLVRGVVGSQRVDDRAVSFGPNEAAVVRAALEDLTGYSAQNSTLTETTIPQLWHCLDEPSAALIAQTRYGDRQHFFDETRLLRNALGQLVTGVLAGMFDEHTNIDIDWNAPIQSLSLSRLMPLGDEAVGIALLALNSWGRGMREVAPAGDLRVVIRDEAWKVMRLGVDAVKALDEDLRLSRGAGHRVDGGQMGGDIQWFNAHKPSDMLTVGDQGSQSAAIARDLVHLAGTKILHGQEPKIARELDDLLGLGPIATDAISGWAMQRKGRALWVVGEQMYKVQTVLHPVEEHLTWTNEGIAAAA
jgi:hypothetical protein